MLNTKRSYQGKLGTDTGNLEKYYLNILKFA